MAPLTGKEFADWLLDDEKLPVLFETFIADSLMEHGRDEDEAFRRFLKAWLRTMCNQAAERIRSDCGSPLERVFLLALMLGFVKFAPLKLTVTPTFSTDAPNIIANYRHDHVDALVAMRNYREQTGDEKLMGMIDFLMAPNCPVPAPGTLLRHVFGEVFDMWGSFHLTLQPRFENIRVDGKTIRPDALIWIPSDPAFKVVIELDGYDYHSDKPMFTADRRRDRVLTGNGYRVIRFSGQEVFADPIDTALETLHLLTEFRGEKGDA
jgi:hypothetical protein